MENQIESEREERELKITENDQASTETHKKKCPQILNLYMQAQQLNKPSSSSGKFTLSSLDQVDPIRDQTLLLELQSIIFSYACLQQNALKVLSNRHIHSSINRQKTKQPSQISSSLDWHGVYFVKQGIYSGGIFKFIIEFPSLYPNVRPSVRFHNQVFHPLVSPNSLELNLDFEFKEWVPGKHWLINVLLYIKKMFHLEQMYSLNDKESEVNPSNKEAHQLYLTNFPEFVKNCKKCVEQSKDSKFNNPASSLLKFTQYVPIHDKIIEQIKTQCNDSQDLFSTKEALKNWFFHNFQELVQQTPKD